MDNTSSVSIKHLNVKCTIISESVSCGATKHSSKKAFLPVGFVNKDIFHTRICTYGFIASSSICTLLSKKSG